MSAWNTSAKASAQPDCWCEGFGGRYPLYDEFGLCVAWRELCTCEAGQRARQEAEANAATSRSRRIKRYLEDSGIPPRFRQFDLQGSPQRKLARQLMEAPGDSSWLLWGPPGRGKTGLAAGYLKHWVEQNVRRAAFVPLPRLLSELRASYDADYTELDVLDRYATIPLLVLDDLGAEAFGNEAWFTDRLYQIIGARHDSLRPMIFTSNLTPEDLARRLGERIWWRVIESCGPERIVHVAGPNLRMQGCAQERTHGCTTSSSAG